MWHLAGENDAHVFHYRQEIWNSHLETKGVDQEMLDKTLLNMLPTDLRNWGLLKKRKPCFTGESTYFALQVLMKKKTIQFE